MRYSDWKLINEAMGPGAMPLGMSKPSVVGTMGSKFGKDKLEDEDDDDLGDDELDDEESEEEEPDDDFEDDFETDDSGDDLDDTESDALAGGDSEIGDAPNGGANDLPDEMGDTLSGIDPDLAGLGDDDSVGGMGDAPMGDEMGDAPMGDEMGDSPVADIPCTKCNPDGEGLPGEGDPNCPDCNGENFVSDMGGFGGENPGGDVPPDDIDAEIEDDAAPMPVPEKQCSKCCGKFMSNCECTDDFMDSLKRSVGTAGQPKRVTETKKSPQAGQVGFAPQSRVGSIGGGYTMDDFKEIPVLGESFQYLTFEGWMKKKNKS